MCVGYSSFANSAIEGQIAVLQSTIQSLLSSTTQHCERSIKQNHFLSLSLLAYVCIYIYIHAYVIEYKRTRDYEISVFKRRAVVLVSLHKTYLHCQNLRVRCLLSCVLFCTQIKFGHSYRRHVADTSVQESRGKMLQNPNLQKKKI